MLQGPHFPAARSESAYQRINPCLLRAAHSNFLNRGVVIKNMPSMPSEGHNNNVVYIIKLNHEINPIKLCETGHHRDNVKDGSALQEMLALCLRTQ